MTLRTPTSTEVTTRNCIPGCTRCARTRTAPTAPLKVRLSVRRFQGAWRLEVIADGSPLMGFGRWKWLIPALVAKWKLGAADAWGVDWGAWRWEMVETVMPVRVVDRMLEVLAKPEAWTKGSVAMDALGHYCSPMDSEAVCFCVYGAQHRSVSDMKAHARTSKVITATLRDECSGRFSAMPAVYNDLESTTHADILALLKAVRARLEAACTA